MMIIIELISQKSLKQSLASFPPSLIIHISVDIVYVGIKSPMKDMNSIGFIPVANLLLVLLNRRAVVITLNIYHQLPARQIQELQHNLKDQHGYS